MAIKRVWVESFCIRCSLAADTCPDLFVLPDAGPNRLRPGVDLKAHGERIKEAAAQCPVQAIGYEEEP